MAKIKAKTGDTPEKPKKTSNSDVDAIFKKYEGKIGYMCRAGENKKKLDVLSTGSLLLDYRIPFGGIPQGRITHIYGPTRSLKTTIGIKAIKSAFEKYENPQCLVLDFERTMDHYGAINYYKYLGLTEEQASNILVIRDTPEKCFDFALDFVRMDDAAVVLVDSVGAIVPSSDYIKSFEEHAKVAARATLVKAFLSQVNMANKNAAIIMINQVLDAFNTYGGMGAKQYTYGGGRSLEHMPSLSLDVKGYHVKGDRLNKESVNTQIQLTVRIDKCKIGDENQQIPILFDLETGQFDIVKDCLALAEELGIIVQSGSWYYMYDKPGSDTLLLKSHGKDEHHNTIRNTPELLQVIETYVLNEIENNRSAEFESRDLLPDDEIDEI